MIILKLYLILNIKQNRVVLKLRQMLQNLPISLPQVKARNTSENFLNEISQIIYSFYQAK